MERKNCSVKLERYPELSQRASTSNLLDLLEKGTENISVVSQSTSERVQDGEKVTAGMLYDWVLKDEEPILNRASTSRLPCIRTPPTDLWQITPSTGNKKLGTESNFDFASLVPSTTSALNECEIKPLLINLDEVDFLHPAHHVPSPSHCTTDLAAGLKRSALAADEPFSNLEDKSRRPLKPQTDNVIQAAFPVATRAPFQPLDHAPFNPCTPFADLSLQQVAMSRLTFIESMARYRQKHPRAPRMVSFSNPLRDECPPRTWLMMDSIPSNSKFKMRYRRTPKMRSRT